MRVDSVKEQLKQHGLEDNYLEFDTSSATVELAAAALGCEPGRIAKTLAFVTSKGPVVIVAMGTSKVDNRKYKDFFGEKAVFPNRDQVLELTGHPAGGVCPFALNPGVQIYLDKQLHIFDTIYPAAGATNNAVKITPLELEKITQGIWVDVCK